MCVAKDQVPIVSCAAGGRPLFIDRQGTVAPRCPSLACGTAATPLDDEVVNAMQVSDYDSARSFLRPTRGPVPTRQRWVLVQKQCRALPTYPPPE